MTKATQKDITKLLKTLEASGPIGKDGTAKSVVKPFPQEIAQFLSSEKTKVPTVEEITLEELFNIAAINIQRDVTKRLGKNRKYLSNDITYCMETGRMFTAVRYPDGTMNLVDGNTRVAAYYNELIRCIETGKPPRFQIPATVVLTIHEQNSVEEGMLLYLTLDNGAASEKPLEKMQGVKDVLGIEFKKDYLDKVNFKTGLKVAASKIPGINIETIPNEEFGLMKEFREELEYMDNHSKFDDSPIGGDDIAVLAAMFRKFRHSRVMKEKIMELANKVFSPNSNGCVVMPNGGKNAAMMLRDEYYCAKKHQRFGHRSAYRAELMGFWVHYLAESEDDKIMPRATSKSDDILKRIGNDFLSS